MCQIPHNASLKGPKYRDLLSSLNWLFANQSFFFSSTPTPHEILLEQVATCVLTSIQNSNKSGEKARRVICEGLRAFRTLILSAPVTVIPFLTSDSNLGSLTFFTGYLSYLAKPLRDNAALLLSAVAWGLTVGWNDRSIEGAKKQIKTQELVSTELYVS